MNSIDAFKNFIRKYGAMIFNSHNFILFYIVLIHFTWSCKIIFSAIIIIIISLLFCQLIVIHFCCLFTVLNRRKVFFKYSQTNFSLVICLFQWNLSNALSIISASLSRIVCLLRFQRSRNYTFPIFGLGSIVLCSVAIVWLPMDRQTFVCWFFLILFSLLSFRFVSARIFSLFFFFQWMFKCVFDWIVCYATCVGCAWWLF